MEDIKLSTLERVASSLGKRLKVSIVPIEQDKFIAKPSSGIQASGRRTSHTAKKRTKSVAYKKAGEKE